MAHRSRYGQLVVGGELDGIGSRRSISSCDLHGLLSREDLSNRDSSKGGVNMRQILRPPTAQRGGPPLKIRALLISTTGLNIVHSPEPTKKSVFTGVFCNTKWDGRT